MNENERQLLTRVEAANYLYVGLSTLDRETREGRISRVDIRGAVRYERSELEAYIDRQRRTNCMFSIFG